MSDALASHIEKLLLCLVLFIGFIGFADGRFTAPICAPDNNCIQKNSQGTWCYIPAPSTSGGTPDCVGPSFKTPDMTPFIAVHIKQGLSIAYYNEVDTALLGDANYSIPVALGRVVLCASGAWAGSFQTQCLPTQQDNNMWPQFNSECIVSIAQDFVSDGCYVPKSGNILTDDPSTSTLKLPPGSLSAPLSSPTRSLHIITPTLTTFIEPTISTIVTNGVTQTIVVAPFNASSNGPNQSKGVVLPIVLPLFFVILVALGVFVWWYKKRARERRYFAGPPPFDGPPPQWEPGDGK
ncbi:hypothetical protein GALMADRAFT_143135 [Galerina marginata CBS 339.88]|uniref:CBM1 domain-containing protein n=1 Tax=Galerina marginata (strain CBS 339.88) TaxID=685588 RepID=A0A067SMY9_GALM3|nr:hypothetical protein GALMADRAFT_143135 [Galerina marginata CBS 339.88]